MTAETETIEAGRIARGCHHNNCDLSPCATCPYAAARHAVAEVDAADLAARLAEAFPLPSDIVPALRRLGMRVASVGFLRTPVETWAGILRAVEGGGATWGVNRPLALADFEALLTERETAVCPVCESHSGGAAAEWRAVALDAVGLVARAFDREAVGVESGSHRLRGQLEARRDALLAAERVS